MKAGSWATKYTSLLEACPVDKLASCVVLERDPHDINWVESRVCLVGTLQNASA